MTLEHILIEIIRLFGSVVLILFALMGYELFLAYKQKKDRDGL
jgi:hypothetical protein